VEAVYRFRSLLIGSSTTWRTSGTLESMASRRKIWCGLKRRANSSTGRARASSLVDDFLEIMILFDCVRTRRRGPRVHGLKEALQMRIPSERIVRAFHYASGTIEPAPSRHIRDGIGVPNDEGAVREMVIQDLIVPLRLASVTVDGVAEPFGRHMLEMHSLAGGWAEARGDEEQPGEELRPVPRCAGAGPR